MQSPMAQLNGSSGSHASSTHRLPASERSVRDYTGEPASETERKAAYAAVLVIGPISDSEVADFARAGRTVRTFLEIDESLAALVLGRVNEANLTTRPSANGDSVPQRGDSRTGESERARSTPEHVLTHDSTFASEVCAQLDPLLPNGPIRELFHLSARKTRKRLSVLQASEALGVEREKLTTMLHEAGLPAPNEVIRQHRLLHAAWLLGRTPKRTVEEVATALGFASGPVLGNAMKVSMGAR